MESVSQKGLRILTEWENKRKPSQPVFTQSMADNGELPQVGMECMLSNGVTYEKATILFVSDKHVVYLNDDGEWCKYRSDIDVKPIDTRTDKEKAIDEACLIIGDSKRCVDTNINIDCSVAQKAVVITMINNGYRKVGE